MYRAVLALIARRHRDGLAASPLLQEAHRTLYRACLSAGGHEDAPAPRHCQAAGRQDGDWIGIAEAAEVLGVSRRQTRRLAANGLHGVRCGSIWVLSRSAVLALADERKASA